MKELNINLRLRITPGLVRWATALLCLSLLATEVSPENITLTTYYPAPSGIYVNMVTTRQTILARDSGNVGIGTTNPGQRLVVLDAGNGTNDTLQVYPQNMTQGVGIGYNHINEIGSNGNNSLYINSQTNGNLLLQSQIASGNVGIGTVSPAAKLEINSPSAPALQVDSGNHAILTMLSTAGCNKTVDVGGALLCTGGQYAAWMPGVATVGTVYGQPPGGEPPWTPGEDIPITTVFYCCPW